MRTNIMDELSLEGICLVIRQLFVVSSLNPLEEFKRLRCSSAKYVDKPLRVELARMVDKCFMGNNDVNWIRLIIIIIQLQWNLTITLIHGAEQNVP